MAMLVQICAYPTASLEGNVNAEEDLKSNNTPAVGILVGIGVAAMGLAVGVIVLVCFVWRRSIARQNVNDGEAEGLMVKGAMTPFE